MSEHNEIRRFWPKVRFGLFCWEWQGARDRDGYGIFRYRGGQRAHRFSWQLHFGPIPEALLVCHRCDNPGCVNPGHLFVGSHRDNVIDAFDKKRRAVGSRVVGSKLDEADVADILMRSAAGETRTALAKKFNVTISLVSAIVHGRAWKHVRTPTA